MMLLAQASSQDQSAAGMAALAAFGVFYVIALLAFVAFTILCHWLVAKKAGYNPVLSLLLLVPLANIVVYLIFVFGEWPIQAENRALRAQSGRPPHGPLYPPSGGLTYETPLTPGPGPIAPA